MREHRGMRPQDVAVLLKIAAYRSKDWMGRDLAGDLCISESEICESLNRSQFADLLDSEKRIVNRQGLFAFLEYGFRYTFPVKPEGIIKGIPAAYSAPLRISQLKREESYVWPSVSGKSRGQMLP